MTDNNQNREDGQEIHNFKFDVLADLGVDTDQLKELPDLPGMGGVESGGFDPRRLPGAQVVFDETDEDGNGLLAVAVPMSALRDPEPVGGPHSMGFLGDALEALGLGNPLAAMRTNFQQMRWADDENTKAMERHGEAAPEGDAEGGPILRSYSLASVVEQPYMAPERLFRAHAAEIYDRVARGEDTRPGTDAEVLGLLVDASLVTPFCPGMTCLYFRLVAKVLPDMFAEFKAGTLGANGPDFDQEAYEKLHSEDADEHYADLVKVLTRDRRRR